MTVVGLICSQAQRLPCNLPLYTKQLSKTLFASHFRDSYFLKSIDLSDKRKPDFITSSSGLFPLENGEWGGGGGEEIES